MQRAIAYFLLLLGLFTMSAQAALVSGPMISHIDMREAKIWIQVDAPSLVRIAYSVAGDSDSSIGHPLSKLITAKPTRQ